MKHTSCSSPRRNLYNSIDVNLSFRHTVPDQTCNRSAQNRNGRGQVIPLCRHETRTRYDAPPRIRSESTAHRRGRRSLSRRVDVPDYGSMMWMSELTEAFPDTVHDPSSPRNNCQTAV